MTTPPRRWFRYSLRTLFVVVTFVACWLGYELNWIRQRHALLDEINLVNEEMAQWEQRQELPQAVDGSFTVTAILAPPQAPGLLWLFGEKGVPGLSLVFIQRDSAHPVDEASKKRLARNLFPEATIIDVKVIRDASGATVR